MRALLQRVREAEVRVGGQVRGRIGRGILVFLGCRKGDDPALARGLAERCARYRIFEDETGRTQLDLARAGGDLLVISQFTLVADTRKGLRPSFDPALPPGEARECLAAFVERLRELGHRVEEGEFGASMEVRLVNDGPATYLLDTDRG